MSYIGTASSDDKEIFNLFATFFKTTYSTEIFNDFKKYPYSLQSFDFPIPVIDEWSVLCWNISFEKFVIFQHNATQNVLMYDHYLRLLLHSDWDTFKT